MICFGTCTCESFKLKELYTFLQKDMSATLIEDAIHVKWSEEADVFFFCYGVVVFWGIGKNQSQQILSEIEPFENHPNEELETDKFNYELDDSVQLQHEKITIPNEKPLTLLSVSHALAQSVKLQVFERTVKTAVQSMGKIPHSLAKEGKIPLSRKQIRMKMGELFVDRSSINLHLDVLDVPEFFSDYPSLEPYYEKTRLYLEIAQRLDVVNQRLDVVHRFFELLSSELNHQHSCQLEWTIILLILVEVILTFLLDVFQVF